MSDAFTLTKVMVLDLDAAVATHGATHGYVVGILADPEGQRIEVAEVAAQ